MVVARHDALRIRVVEAGDRQQFLPPEQAAIVVEVADLRSRPEEAAELGRRLAAAVASRRWDTAAKAPFRVFVALLPDGRQLLLLAAHPVAVDFASLEIVAVELAALYGTASGSRPSDREVRHAYEEYVVASRSAERAARAGRGPRSAFPRQVTDFGPPTPCEGWSCGIPGSTCPTT
jgi:hypothetical protein